MKTFVIEGQGGAGRLGLDFFGETTAQAQPHCTGKLQSNFSPRLSGVDELHFLHCFSSLGLLPSSAPRA